MEKIIMNYQRILIGYIFTMIGFLMVIPNSIVYSDNSKDFKKFTFDCPPDKITAYYTEMKESDKFGRNQYLVQFTPHLVKTDGNLYLASLQCVFNIFQKDHGQGGLFLLESAEIKYDEILKNNATYWKLPSGKGLYVIPLVDSKTEKLFAIIIYLK